MQIQLRSQKMHSITKKELNHFNVCLSSLKMEKVLNYRKKDQTYIVNDSEYCGLLKRPKFGSN